MTIDTIQDNQNLAVASATPACPPNRGDAARSTLVSRNVTISGKRTSVRLEPEMWDGLREICRRERASLHQICSEIARRKSQPTSLTAAIRVYAMTYYRIAATEEGHTKAGHGFSLILGVGTNNNQPRPRPPSVNLPFGKSGFA